MPKRIFAVLYVSVVTKRQFFTFMLLITEMIWFAVVLPSCIKATTRCSIGTAWSFVRGDEITKGITEKLSKTLRCCAKRFRCVNIILWLSRVGNCSLKLLSICSVLSVCVLITACLQPHRAQLKQLVSSYLILPQHQPRLYSRSIAETLLLRWPRLAVNVM